MDHLDGCTWRKSSYSGSNGGNCIEVTATPGTVAVRDGNDPYGPVLTFGSQDWQRFAGQLKAAQRSSLSHGPDGLALRTLNRQFLR